MRDAARPTVRQPRVVVEADDHDAAVAFFRDALGLPEQAAYSGGGDERVVILEAGRATLELANPSHVRPIDAVETDGVTSPRIRLAFEVEDAVDATTRLADAGGEVLATPRETPRRSLNVRLQAPADLQITLFEELETLEEREQRDGFGTGER